MHGIVQKNLLLALVELSGSGCDYFDLVLLDLSRLCRISMMAHLGTVNTVNPKLRRKASKPTKNTYIRAQRLPTLGHLEP